MNKINYDQIKELQDIYLEDSYLLDIQCENSMVSLNLLAVLTSEHELYQLPLKGEKYCYKKTTIDFLNAKNIQWLNKNFKPNFDPDGSKDYGNIDLLYKYNAKYHVEGEWGAIEFQSSGLKIDYGD